MEVDTIKDEFKPEEDFNSAMPETVEIIQEDVEIEMDEKDEKMLFDKYI
jgi:hypothetical protein